MNLLEKAKEVSKNAYAPFSKFYVGACVVGASGQTYVGCNFENSSYGLAICAERNAIGTAIANGEKSILAIAIYAQSMEDACPCGACRQVIAEFQGDKEIEIITPYKDSYKVYTINELLPCSFKL